MNFRFGLLLSSILTLYILSSCGSGAKESQSETPKTADFESIKGITFHEIRRQFENGLSFDTIGFQQEPEWILKFLRNDRVEIFSPQEGKMMSFHLHHDHDNYYNFGREWFAVKLLSKDSIILQRLEVKSLRIKNDERSNVFMTFYSEDYMANKLKTAKGELQKPNKADTIFVKERIKLANDNPLDSNYLFAARKPVQLSAKSKAIKVNTYSSFDPLTKSSAYDYLYPEFKIEISNAYKKFNYAFRVIVDVNKNIKVYDFPSYEEDTKENRHKVLQGICDIYLRNMLNIIPGSTLGIPHASLITLYVKGEAKP